MHSVKLDVRSHTDHGCAHAHLCIDGHDTGALYLNQTELTILVSALRSGCLQSNDVIFEKTEPDDGQFEYDVFDE